MWIPLLRAGILQGLLQNVVKCSLHCCWRAILLEALFNIPNTFPFTPSYAQKIDKEDPQIIKKVSLWRALTLETKILITDAPNCVRLYSIFQILLLLRLLMYRRLARKIRKWLYKFHSDEGLTLETKKLLTDAPNSVRLFFNILNTSLFTPSYVTKVCKEDRQIIQ